MLCSHCCNSCGPKGANMGRKVFEAACKIAYSRGDHIFIGGGEPTLHPDLFGFIGIALSYDSEGMLGMVTNGKITEAALRLSWMARRGILSVELSQDSYHEPIEQKVVDAFTVKRDYMNRNTDDRRGIRTVSRISAMGRAASWGDDTCACEDLVVTWDGSIYQCGHQTRKFGTVFKPKIPDDYESQTCSQQHNTEEE